LNGACVLPSRCLAAAWQQKKKKKKKKKKGVQ
jgi:hypothetical protein